MARKTMTPRILPNPGSVAMLGTMLHLDVKEANGRVVRHEWDPGTGPPLLWSPTAKAFYIFPKMRLSSWRRIVPVRKGPMLREQRLDMKELYHRMCAQGQCLPPDMLGASKLFTRWALRPPTDFTHKTVDEHKLVLQGCGTMLDYRSDKWNGRNGKKINYTHDLSSTDSDKVSTTGDGTMKRPPTCIFVKGPRLTVTERGIIY